MDSTATAEALDRVFDHDGSESEKTKQRRKALAERLREAEWAMGRPGLSDSDATKAAVVSKVAVQLETCTTRPVGAWLFPGGQDNKLARGVCRHRICPHCHSIRMSRLGKAMSQLVKDELAAGATLAVLTLTLKHSRLDGLKYLRRVVASAWSKLTKRAFWKALVEEYHRVAEVERTRKNGWHPHFHVLVRLAFNRAKANECWRNGELHKSKLFQWWAAKMYGRGWRRQCLDGREVLGAVAAQFLSITPHDLEIWLTEEWESITGAAGHKSDQIRLEMVKRGPVNKEGQPTVLHPKTGKPRVVEKFVAELVKYTTKGGGRGGRGKLTMLEYSPPQLAEYITGLKHWRLHQSSRGWSKITKEFEREDLEAEQELRDKMGARFVPFVNLVAQIEESLLGVATDEVYEQTIQDGLAFMKLWHAMAEEDPDFDRHNLSVLEGCLGRLLGAQDPPRAILEGWQLNKREDFRVLALMGMERRNMRVTRMDADGNEIGNRALAEFHYDVQADRESRNRVSLDRLDEMLRPDLDAPDLCPPLELCIHE